ncbi:MAG TPA: tripartite tricarboxylate transporter substrate binding protein [Beijerinckiaceae bacterium]
MPVTLHRRAVLSGLAAFAAPSVARAQAWPTGRSIRIVCPFTPAGATDVLARLLAQKFGELWSANVVVENKPGAGGNIGTEQVARGEADGSQILIVSVGMATNRFLYPKLSYDPVADFAPASLVALVPNILVAGHHVPAGSTAELVAYCKANPGKVTFASSGVGTSVHLSGELFKRLAGVELVHVPYRGTGPALTDMMGGRVDIMFDNITASYPQVQAGKVKAFGITTAKRSPNAPELAPVAETLPGFDVSSWFALYLPAKTPKEIVARVEADTAKAVADPLVRSRIAALGGEPVGSTGPELDAHLKAEMARWGKLIQEAGIKADG